MSQILTVVESYIKEKIKMQNYNPHEKNIQKQCDVCGNFVMVDRFGGGICKHCGWVQTSLDRPDEIHWSYNFVSFNKAKQLWRTGKPVKPDFEDFLECMKVYGELEFYCNGKHYGVLSDSKGKIDFYEWNVMDRGYQVYYSIEEFAAKANIDGVLLRDIWDSVEGVDTAS